jgi:8-oxo-dGTP pyrophosphatase MutT (NUDIX family)
VSEAHASDELFSVVESKRVFEGKVASVRIDTLVMPGGGTANREVVEHQRAVAVVALDEDDSVVLIEQYRHPLRRRLWELPAGLMDVDGESARSAAERELGEETGLHAATWSLLVDVAASPGFTDEVVRVFLATGVTDIGRQGTIEHEEADLKIVRVPLAAAVDAALAGSIVNASTVAGLLAASIVRRSGSALRSADDPWTDGAGTVHVGPGVGLAAVLPHNG